VDGIFMSDVCVVLLQKQTAEKRNFHYALKGQRENIVSRQNEFILPGLA
jgi:hypothetical protein